MKNLINFLIKYSVVFLFIALELASLALIIENRSYQRSVFLSSSNSFVSGLLQAVSSVEEFFSLASINRDLSQENTQLRNRLSILQTRLASIEQENYSSITIPPEQECLYISANVIGNTTNRVQNYITLNKGWEEGVRPDMGVINKDGVVGIVKTVSKHFATVIPILNPMLQLNVKFKRSNYSGPLVWKGDDYRYANMGDIARHVNVMKGDTIITSGLTSVFPAGIMVGVVDDYRLDDSSPYFNISVKLAVNFRTISYVNIIRYLNYTEQKKLEDTAEE